MRSTFYRTSLKVLLLSTVVLGREAWSSGQEPTVDFTPSGPTKLVEGTGTGSATTSVDPTASGPKVISVLTKSQVERGGAATGGAALPRVSEVPQRKPDDLDENVLGTLSSVGGAASTASVVTTQPIESVLKTMPFQSMASPAPQRPMGLCELVVSCFISPPPQALDDLRSVTGSLVTALDQQRTRAQSQLNQQAQGIMGLGQSMIRGVAQDITKETQRMVGIAQQVTESIVTQGGAVAEREIAITTQQLKNVEKTIVTTKDIERQVKGINQIFEDLGKTASVLFNPDATISVGQHTFQSPALLLLASQVHQLAPETKMVAPMAFMFMDARRQDLLMQLAQMLLEQDDPKTSLVMGLTQTGEQYTIGLSQDGGAFIRSLNLATLFKPNISSDERDTFMSFMRDYVSICAARARDESQLGGERSSRNYIKNDGVLAQVYHTFVVKNPNAVLGQNLDIRANSSIA